MTSAPISPTRSERRAMTERTNERTLGRLEAQMEVLLETVKQINTNLANADLSREEMRSDIRGLQEHAKEMIEVAERFKALQQMIRDSRMTGRGVMIGIGLAGGAVGATVATFFKTLWAAIFGA